MADFNQAFAVLLQMEGGWSNHASDPGGPTKFGISLRALQRRGYSLDLDHDGDTDAADMRLLTVEQAATIYRADYWLPIYDRIREQALANKIFDMAVNMGHKAAHVIVQRAVRGSGRLELKADGRFGEKTLAALHGVEAELLLTFMRHGQWIYYEELIANNPSLAEFQRGWRTRCLT